MEKWGENSNLVLEEISEKYSKRDLLAIRSSTKTENTVEASMADAFHSDLNVNAKSKSDTRNSILEVIGSFYSDIDNKVLVQPMISNVLK